MSMEGIELYNVKDEGDLEQMAITGPIKDMLNSEMVVLLVVDAQKMIYLWKGSNAKVRRKFIAARVSQDLRGQKGLNYKVDSIDHGDEPAGFINIAGGPVAMAAAPGAAPAGGMAAMPSMSPTVEAQPLQPASNIPSQPAIVSPQPIVQPTIQPAVQPAPGTQIPDNIEDSVKNIINEIEKHPPPPPYTRELVFIGPYAFSITETKRTAFGEENIERRWELASPPEGQFIATGYTPRAIIQAGKVLAVELMKGGATEGSSDTQIQVFKIKYQK
ncbi:MAG: hypothetical protein HWN66_19130 [Candidatus Helarchaeota archaeon]|nr:hypothetical protein [Candidatus Helarchaeota archaeon]